MTEVLPSVLYTFYADLGASGLEGTAGVAVYLGGTLITARTTSGIAQLGATTVYAVTITTPATPSPTQYNANVDDGTDVQWIWPFTVATDANSQLNPITPGVGPYPGPCLAWTTGDEVAACCSASVGTDTSVFDDAIVAASEFLFNASGRQYPGQCEQTVRPCANYGCGFQVLSRGYVIWPGDWLYANAGWGWNGNTWRTPAFTGCGCAPLSRVLLPGVPVVSITEVTIDGDIVPADEYRLDDYRYLTRLGETDGVAHHWPACQALEKDLGEIGTWGVTYQYGQTPPYLGQNAAKALACEIYKACDPDAECALPDGVTRIIRQGITIERLPTLTFAFQKYRMGARGEWRTGIGAVDLFLNSFAGNGIMRRPTVWSPAFAYSRRYGGAS
jgi:hypothetical protein